jgi:hypothetical protein
MIIRNCVAMLPWIVCCGMPVLAEEDQPTTLARPSREQCDQWVQQLANRSPRPFEQSYVLRPPRNIDRQALNEVKAAYDALSMHFAIALPSLIPGLSDHRYSYYQEVPSNGSFMCHDVGHACRSIISANVEVYRPFLVMLDKTGVPRTVHFISEMGGAEKWFADRKGKSLLELQREAVDWALAQPAEPRMDAKKWEMNVAALRTFRDEMASRKTPFDPKHRLQFECK